MLAISGRPPTIERAVREATRTLDEAALPDGRLEAEWLLALLLRIDRGSLFVRMPDAIDCATLTTYREWAARRARREPQQYITGSCEFYGLELRVDRRALIPRPETEGLVEAVLRLPPGSRAAVADLGTGSGCVAVALAVTRPDLRLRALDRSPAALELAGENARRHAVSRRVELVEGDLTSPPPAWNGTLDVVVCNPPYVTDDEWLGLAPEVRDHEPRAALVAGPTGLEAYRALAPAASRLLRHGGRLILELGQGQAPAVTRILEQAGFGELRILPDLRRIPRVVVAAREGNEVGR